MRRLILLLASIGVAVLLASGAALGITGGWADDGVCQTETDPPEPEGCEDIKYTNVGALVEFPKEGKSGEPYPYCTGTLISDTVFLTAAHCGDKLVEAVEVTFEPDFDPLPTRSDPTVHDGTFYADPNGYDIAVVKFSEPISGIPTADLPSFHQFENVAKGQKFTAVGYGGQEPVKQRGWGWVINYQDEREYAVSTYKSVNQTYLSLSQNLNQDNGGTCYGDSGGPNFLGAVTDDETSVIAGITSTGDTWCKATNVTLRLDIKPVRDFLRAQGVLPVTECSDGLDNDKDGKIDFNRRGDPDCVSETDNSENS